MDYWEECIIEALEEAKLPATKDQIGTIVAWVEGAFENYEMATGLNVADANFISEDTRELDRPKAEIEKKETWVPNTNTSLPCKVCNSTGSIPDGLGRNRCCYFCGGKGRI